MVGTENILAADGYNLALTGMLIVFAALTLITLAISVFPRVLKIVDRTWPEPQAHAPAAPAAE